MKRIIAILCSITLCVTTAVPAFAATDTYTETVPVKFDAYTEANDYVDSIEDAAAVLRQQMTKRAKTATVYYRASSSSLPDMDTLVNTIYDEAMRHTGKSNEGDVLKWSWKDMDCDLAFFEKDQYYLFTLVYHITYYTTPAQEEEVIAGISALKSKLQLENRTEFEIVNGIYTYICNNVSYDYKHLYDDSYEIKYTDYAALFHKTSVCQGYALLFYRLALEYGIDARLIPGIADSGPHAWNIVKIGDLYYYLDATWDSERNPDEYFLKGSETFLVDHFYNPGLEHEEIVDEYPISTTDFNGSLHVHDLNAVTVSEATLKKDGLIRETCSNCTYTNDILIAKVNTVSLSQTKYVYNGKVKSPTIIIKDANGKKLEKGTDYTVTIPKYRKNVGKYTYTIKFMGDYTGSKKLTMTIKPTKPVIKSPTAAHKAVTVKWQKVKKQTSGYQVMVATNNKFTKNVKKTFVKQNKTSVKISGLKTKKTYYVKIRTYKTVNGIKIYSDWSKVKQVKTR